MRHVAIDHIARIRPGGILVWIVIGPHAIVDPPPGKQLATDVVVENGGVDLPVKILARQFIDADLLAMTMALEILIALAEPERHPADFILHGNNLQFGIAFQHAGEDDIEKRVLDLAVLLHADAIALNAMAGLAVHAVAEPGENMKMNGQVKVLRGGPKTLVVFRSRREFGVRHLLNHATNHSGLFGPFHLRDRVVDVVH